MKTRILIIIPSVCAVAVILSLVLNSNENPANWYYGNIRIAENDKFCHSTLTVHHVSLSSIDLNLFVREQIAKFGSQYDFPDRRIEIKQINPDTFSIIIGGSWKTSNSTDHPNLMNIFSTMEGAEVEEKVVITCS